VPFDSLDSDVAKLVGDLPVLIGVRLVNGKSITISDCEFDIAGAPVLTKGPISVFGAGIFATGQCSGLRIEGNQFSGPTVEKPSPFWTGFLLVPSVALNSSSESSSGTSYSAANGGTVVPSSLSDAIFEKNSFARSQMAALILGEAETVEFRR